MVRNPPAREPQCTLHSQFHELYTLDLATRPGTTVLVAWLQRRTTQVGGGEGASYQDVAGSKTFWPVHAEASQHPLPLYFPHHMRAPLVPQQPQVVYVRLASDVGGAMPTAA